MPFLSHQGSWLNSLLPWRKGKRSVEFVEVSSVTFAEPLDAHAWEVSVHAIPLVAVLYEKHIDAWHAKIIGWLQVGPAGSDSAVAVEGAVALASPRMMSQQRPSTAPARASSDGEPLAEGCRILCLLIAASHEVAHQHGICNTVPHTAVHL